MKPLTRLSLLVAMGTLLSGCTSTKTSNTARTATEQMLISHAIDESLDKVNFSPLGGQRVYLEEKYLDCVDKGYLIGSVRHRIMRTGGALVATPEEADVVMEVRSGGVGTDSTDAFIGIPEITLPGMLTLPEIRLSERKTQQGYSKIGIVTYDAKSKQVLGDGGISLAQADDNNWYVLGMGPMQNGTLKGDRSRSRGITSGMYSRQLPTQVALGTRDQLSDENPFRYASESSEK